MAISTKDLVQILDIRDDIIILKNGSLRTIVKVSSLNFELRSTDEQMAIIQNFQNFVNSADFPIQIVVRSVQLDLSDYAKSLEEATKKLDNELLKIQSLEYSKFVSELAELSNIMTKSFYVVVPFYSIDVPQGKGILDNVKSMFKRTKKNLNEVYDDVYVNKYRAQIMQRTDLVLSNLVGLGLKTELVKGNDLMNLFYSIYNPGQKANLNIQETQPQQ